MLAHWGESRSADNHAVPFLTSPDGVRLKYELEGSGPPLLLHLGAGGDSGLWQAAGYLEPLSKSYQCILFDHRGHGESDHPRGVEANCIDRYEDDVVALLDLLGITSTAFWGYSAGLSVGLKVAHDHPSRVRALIGSGGMSKTSPSEEAEFVARLVPELQEYGWEKMLARFTKRETEAVPEWMKERIRATDTEQFIDFLEAGIDSGWDEWEALPRVKAPTLVLTGELEDPDDETAAAVARMPDGRRVRQPRLAHINSFLRSDLALPLAMEFLAATQSE
jgi:pimeloyl-ACP methyl ester carboxylesterase